MLLKRCPTSKLFASDASSSHAQAGRTPHGCALFQHTANTAVPSDGQHSSILPLTLAGRYAELVVNAELISYYDVSGCYILRPSAFAMWEVGCKERAHKYAHQITAVRLAIHEKI